MSDTPSDPGRPSVRRHPVRGALWGLVGGLGAVMLLTSRAVIALGTLSPLVVIAVFIVLGAVWGSLAPPRRRGAPDPGAV